jgi:glycosyltransferase involved in cell wall biosynthesis
MSKVSVIIPTYNRAQLVGSAIQSVLDQTFTDWEAIVVDDGSQDNTLEVVARYNDPRVRFIHQENKGVSAARNTGIRASSGEYIAFLDSDDRFLPEKLSVQVTSLDRYSQYGLVASGWIDVNQAGEPIAEKRPWLLFSGLDRSDWLYRNPLIPTCILVRRTWIETLGLFDEQLSHEEDYDLWLRLAFAGCRMVWEPAMVCIHTRDGDSLSKQAKHMVDGFVYMLNKLFNRLDLPEDIRNQRQRIYANAYLDAAIRMVIAGMATESRTYLTEAIRLNPALLEGNPPEAMQSLSSAILDYPNYDQKEYINTVCQVVKNVSQRLACSPREFKAMIQATTAFKYFALGHRGEARLAAIRALSGDLSWLQNRGLLSILLKP